MSEGQNNCSDSQSKKIKTINQLETLDDGEIPDLPEEIIVQILKILPVKSLLRFKCVCKSWFSLISSSEFIKTHLKHSINNTNLINHRIMFTISHPDYNLKHCSAHSLMFEPLTDTYEIDYPEKNPQKFVRIVGSCDGLICFAMCRTRKNVYLWNPSTRTSKKLPSPAVKLKRSFYCMYGFGYNESDDDYKVVAIFRDSRNTTVNKSPVKIYSFRTNSWKMIGDFEAAKLMDDYGKFASGKLHFLVKQKVESNYKLAIISIDLESEVYGKVDLPNYEEDYSVPLLGVLGGCICVTLNYRKIRADVWVLKQYDVKESWTKVVSIPYRGTLEFGLQSRHRVGFYSNPVLMLPSGEFLLVLAECLLIYNSKDDCFRGPSTRKFNYFLEADTYVESLVSL